jgi:parvulin-like peptidyl-prolyl isomerase
MSTTIFQAINQAKSLALLGFVVLVLLAGCRQKPGLEEEDANGLVTEPNVEVSPVLGEAVAARVNGVDIMQAEVDEFVAARIEMLKAKPEQNPDAYIAQRAKEWGKEYLRKLVVNQLLDDQAKEEGIIATDEEVQERVTKLAQEQTPKMTLQQYLQAVEASGESISVFEARVKRQIAWDKLVESKIAGQYEVTEEEALAYFNKYPDNFSTVELVRASHIVIQPIDDSDPNSKAVARATAEDLLQQLKEGADFAELALDYSEDATGVNGGDLKYFKRGDMELPFDEVAFSLPVGQLSDVVETSFGYHIIKVVDHKASENATFDAVKAPLIAELAQNKKHDLVKEYLLNLHEEAEVFIK